MNRPLPPHMRAEYVAGKTARTLGQSQRACPYSALDLYRRCLWLGGWNDTDMEAA